MGPTGIGCASVAPLALLFFFSPSCARLASQRSRVFLSFDWNEEVMGESRRVCGIVGASSRCRRIRGFPSFRALCKRTPHHGCVRKACPNSFHRSQARREASFAQQREKAHGFGACERWRRDLGGNVGLLYILDLCFLLPFYSVLIIVYFTDN